MRTAFACCSRHLLVGVLVALALIDVGRSKLLNGSIYNCKHVGIAYVNILFTELPLVEFSTA